MRNNTMADMRVSNMICIVFQYNAICNNYNTHYLFYQNIVSSNNSLIALFLLIINFIYISWTILVMVCIEFHLHVCFNFFM